LARILFLVAAAALVWTQAGDPSRELLPVPGIVARAGVASPTRAPWVNANGWRFVRRPGGKFRYDLPAGKAALAAAEVCAYRADAVLKLDPSDEARAAAMRAFCDGLPSADLPPIADIGIVDDGSDITGEVMNLLARRNLLYEVVKTPSPRFRLNIAMGSPDYPVSDAADPSAFALKIRRQLTDEQRALRIYGSEVVIARFTGDGARTRLHLINYGGREIEGLRVRLRGSYGAGNGYVEGAGRVALIDHVVSDGATECSLQRLGVYAVIDLNATR
jgi:hypothetical protein